ncbi:MAG: histidine--tRNA ligase [Anaerolineales bacterium]|jgi:histidyl-tRNA synthetase
MEQQIKSLKGTRDFYPEDMAIRTWLYDNIRHISESYGYQEYEGPLLESIELYAAKSGEELVKEQSFVFSDRSGDLITLRPELTPTLVRMVAQRQQELYYPLRWWSFGPFWRYERPQKGRGREFFQWNIDLIGVDSPEADAEMAAIMASFFKKVGLTSDEVIILINNRRLMDQQLADLDLPADKRPQIYRLIDKRDKLSPKDWENYAIELGVNSSQIDGLNSLLENMDLWEQSDELIDFFKAVDALGVEDYVQYAPHIIRGLDYYTGTVFEAQAQKEGLRRAVLGGGRYDNLMSDVGGDPLPGVGFAMGDMVITLTLEEFGHLPVQRNITPAPVIVTVFDKDHLFASYSLAANLRGSGLKVACFPIEDKLSKQFRYADRIGAKVAVVLGPEEVDNNQVAIKNLKSRDQQTVPRDEVVEAINQILAGESPS